MHSLESLQVFLGWSVVLHSGFMLFAYAFVLGAGRFVRSTHRQAFGLSDEDLSRAYFLYFTLYKLFIFFFALIPWITLRLMD